MVLNVDSPFNTEQTILSICPGQCGIERGIERSGTKLRVAAYVEIEAFVIQNLIGLMEKGLVAPAPVWADLKSFDGIPFRGKIHGITAGYPCQPFSNAGKRRGTDDPRHLWPYIERVFKASKPVWGFFENVSNHLSLGFDSVYTSLEHMGYTVEAGVYTAQETGAPHQRERLFILAVSNQFRHIYGQPEKQSNERYEEVGDSYTPSKSMGHTECCGQQWINGRESGKEFKNRHKEVAHSMRWGCQEQRNKATLESYIDNNRSNQSWPLGPGPDQHDWEEPRTIESGLGCTVDGYNFREDLLRMYGNGVVEQTAEIAWIDLWNKIGLNTFDT